MKYLLVSFFSIFLVAGCQHSDPQKQAELAISKVQKENHSVNIESDIKFDSAPVIEYSDRSLRNPFYPNSTLSLLANSKMVKNLNLNHSPQTLEKYNLSELGLIGVVVKNGKKSVIVKTPDGDLITLAVGEYIGENNGKLVKIESNAITVNQYIQNQLGGYFVFQKSLTVPELTPGS